MTLLRCCYDAPLFGGSFLSDVESTRPVVRRRVSEERGGPFKRSLESREEDSGRGPNTE